MTQKLYWTQYKNPPTVCENTDCSASVTLAVPIAPNRPRDYKWLCRGCARQHNENWNYKQDKSDADMEKIIRDDMHWNRPTQPFSTLRGKNMRMGDMQQALYDFIDDNIQTPKLHHLPEKIQQAYAVLELSEPLPQAGLKIHYKSLVKKYHPDTANHTTGTDEKIKSINVAYDTILEYMRL